MALEYNKTIERPVDLTGTPNVYLRNKDFNALVASKGYEVYLDRFLACPCKEKGSPSARLSCSNCFGTGYFLSERIKTKAFLSSMNKSTEYKDWSIENIGTVSITTLNNQQVSYMDRIVLYELQSNYSQLTYPIKLEDGKIIAFLDYPPTSIDSMYMFNGDNSPLVKLDLSKVEIGQEGEIILTQLEEELYERTDYIYKNITGISIRYNFMPSYHIIDVTRNIIQSPVEDSSKQVESLNFPFHSVGRASHLVIERGDLIHIPSNMESNEKPETTKVEEFSGNLDLDKNFIVIPPN